MKKFLVVMLALLMVLGMVACKSGGAKVETGKIDVEAGTWQNAFAGIKCQLGDEWTLLSEEEIKANNEKALSAMGQDYAKAIKNASVFTDMMAKHENGKDTMSITFEKLNTLTKKMSEEKYAEASKDSTKGALQSMGMSNVQVSIGTMTFAGKTHSCLDITASYYGQKVYEKLAIVKCGNYMVLFTACTWETNNCQAVLDNFKAV